MGSSRYNSPAFPATDKVKSCHNTLAVQQICLRQAQGYLRAISQAEACCLQGLIRRGLIWNITVGRIHNTDNTKNMSRHVEYCIAIPDTWPAYHLVCAGVIVFVLPPIHIKIGFCLPGINVRQADAAE